MKKNRTVFCLLLALMFIYSAAFAEETLTPDAPMGTNISTEGEPSGATEGDTQDQMEEETQDSAEEETQEPTEEETQDPTMEETQEPTDGEPQDPTKEETKDPAEELTAFYIFISNTTQKGENENVRKIFYQTAADSLSFSWTALKEAANYEVTIIDAADTELYLSQMTETALSLPLTIFAECSSTYVLTVTAYSGAETPARLASAGITFVLVQGQPKSDDGKGSPTGGGGGHRGGGKMPNGMGEEEDGSKVTPGEALTNGHASGTKTMTAFDALEVVVPEEAETVLTLDGTELDVTLDDGQSAFRAAAEENTLVLTPVSDGAKWSVNALALKRLNRSGVTAIRLLLGDTAIDMSTDWQPQGTIHAKLSAAGYVSKDYTLIVTTDGIIVNIENQSYTMNNNNELVGE